MDLPPSAGGRPMLPAAGLPAPVTEWLRRHRGTGAGAGVGVGPGPGPGPGVPPVSAYLYDTAAAGRRAASLRAALPDWADVCYAVKANTFPPVLAALAHAGIDGFDVASAAEARLARDAAVASGRARRLVASGPAKNRAVLAALLASRVEVVNAESLLELRHLSWLVAGSGPAERTVAVTVRVNPDEVPLRGSLRMGGAPTQFGVPAAEVPAVLAAARDLPGIEIVGFHVHAVSNNLDAEAHLAYVAWGLKWSARTAAQAGLALRTVDLGGGIGVPFEGEAEFDLDTFAAGLERMRPPPGGRVVFEPGRWLVTDCGYYAAEVVDVKRAYGTVFVLLRGGINHFQLPTSWDIVHNFTVVPVEEWPYPFERPEVAGEPVTVVGELCTPEDTLARDVTVERVRAGDVVVFPMAGSYGYEFAMHSFLGHPPARRVALRLPPDGRQTPVCGPSAAAAPGTPGPGPPPEGDRMLLS